MSSTQPSPRLLIVEDEALIAEETAAGDLVVCLGAGDITQWAYALPEQLEALGAAA